MFERIIVALDGSERAEGALAFVERLARPRGTAEDVGAGPGVAATTLLLVRVVQPAPRSPFEVARSGLRRLLQPPPPTAHKPVSADDAEVMAEAQRYLDRQALTLRLRGWRAETFVRWGDPGEQLARLATEEGAGLIVCGAAHGEGERPGYGAGATAILARAPVPVLLTRPPLPSRHDPAAHYRGEAPGNPRLRRGG